MARCNQYSVVRCRHTLSALAGTPASSKSYQTTCGLRPRRTSRQAVLPDPLAPVTRYNIDTSHKTMGLNKVGAEMSLTVLSYNIKRVINIIGVTQMIEAL